MRAPAAARGDADAADAAASCAMVTLGLARTIVTQHGHRRRACEGARVVGLTVGRGCTRAARLTVRATDLTRAATRRDCYWQARRAAERRRRLGDGRCPDRGGVVVHSMRCAARRAAARAERARAARRGVGLEREGHVRWAVRCRADAAQSGCSRAGVVYTHLAFRAARRLGPVGLGHASDRRPPRAWPWRWRWDARRGARPRRARRRGHTG